MKKKEREKYEQRLNAIANADKAEYERLVENNDGLQADLRAFRVKLPFRNEREYSNWIDRLTTEAFERAKRENIVGQIPVPEYDNLHKGIDNLIQKHGATKWRTEIYSLALFGKAYPIFYFGLPGGKSKSNPDGTMMLGPDGKPEFEIVIPPNFDASNPVAREILKQHKRIVTPPPKPQAMKNKPRTLDWRPVWEWEKRNPEFTRAEIASLLGYNSVTVRRKLAELDSELNPDK